MAVQAQLATLGLNEQQILKLTPLIQDLSARTGKDLTKSAKEVTSALSTGATTLAKYGVELNATNTLSENLDITVAGLTSTIGGQAQVLADEGIGPLIQMQNAMGDLMEQFGAIIADAIKPFVLWIKDLAEKFQQLSPETKKMIVIIGALVAAIGPLLLALGFLTSTVLPALATGMATAFGPIGLVITAIGAMVAIVYTFWDEIVSTFMGAKAAIMKIGENIANGFRKIPELMFDAWIEFPKAILDSFKDLGRLIKAVVTGDFEAIPEILKSAAINLVKTSPLGGAAIKLGKEFGVGVADEFVTAFQGEMKARAKDVEDVVKLPDIPPPPPPPPPPPGGIVTKLNEQAEAYKKIMKSIADATATAKLFGDAEVTVAAKMDIIRTGIESAIIQFGENSKAVQALKAEYDNLANSIDGSVKKQEELKELANLMSVEVSGAFDTMSGNMIDSLGLASEGMHGYIKGLLKTVAKLISMMLAQSISQSIAGATASGAATGPAAVFTTPAFIATAVGGVLAAFASIPKFAEGGLAFGETLSIVGDNPNAKTDPEVIAPLSKLKDLISFDNINLTSTIRGEDIILVTNRTNANRGFIQ